MAARHDIISRSSPTRRSGLRVIRVVRVVGVVRVIARAVLCLACAAAGASPAAVRSQKNAGRDLGGRTSGVESRWVEETLKGLSVRERVAQTVFAAVQADHMNVGGARFAEVRRLVEESRVGGLIVRGGSPNEVAALTNELQRLSKVPLLFAADYERGLRMQMKSGTAFTNNMGVAAAGDVRAARAQARVTAEEARAVGVHWLFGPVADINNNPENPVINTRSFGEDPRRVAAFVAAAVAGAREGGALSTAKHFPGHGDTAADTHIGLAAIRADRARLDAVELVPFRAAIAAGVDAVMTAHVAAPGLTGDDLPATLSPKLTTDLLRRELKFDGLVVTDSLGMGAITKGFPGGEAAVRALKAGADVLLNPPDVKAAIDAVEEAVRRGEVAESRVDESVRRILRAKFRVGLWERRTVDLAAVNSIVERPRGVREAQETAERSLTLLRNEGALLPLDPARAGRTLFIVVAADDDPEEGRTLVPQITRRASGAKVLRAEARTTDAEYDAFVAEAAKAEAVVVAPFVKRAASKGTVALPGRQAEFVRRLIELKRPLAVVGFGSPYLIRQFPEARVYLTTYAIEDIAQAAAARALFGETPIEGRLPVSIPGLFALGAGLRVEARKQKGQAATH